jgi:hypothetical protein
MLNNIVVDELQKKNIHFFEDVVPTSEEDAIVAMFDANNISNNIDINLGNKEVKNVEIKSVTISYGDMLFDLTSAEDFNKYLLFNKFIERDSTSKTLVTKRIDGKLNPTIRIKNNLMNQLKN